MARRAIVALALIGEAVTGCGPSPAAEVEASEAVTTTTRAPRITDDSGRPPVIFDPCYDIPDEVMEAEGYDATGKELADMPMGWYTFLGCTYSKEDYIPGVRRGYGLNILAGNVSLEEELDKNGHFATHTSINGRPALLEVDSSIRDACTYALETTFGVVFITRLYNTDHPGPAPENEWCIGMDEFVTSIEPYIQD
ncbi:DUF3558 domain-containing protein [Rhodococcus sp. Z13]|uniref:DUF3558 domain-containing protein n=1 Tax=Rhodococcus sacchari TaxID=2962047 RepID=A0ACD4DJP1_9NOCA|nr:DUF3558 domain-containing protein [Rhodococcus sp. Z13]UYP20178.1 DUF3558 domain-containing protein [Rhodococcus sp. Z13]